MTFAPRWERPKIASKGKGRSGPPPRMQEDKTNEADAQPMSFTGPVKGLCLFDAISDVPEGGALMLENWVCGNSVARPRRGMAARNTTIGGPCGGIASYQSGSTVRIFAFGGGIEGAIYEISGPGAPILAIDKLFPTVWSFVQFASAGGEYLIAVGAGNARQIYNGTSWNTEGAITGIDQTKIKQVWVHGARQWFIENNSLNAWYLPVDNIGGEAVMFPTAGVFKKGGYLVAGASWTVDASDTGIQAACIIISSEGECAVYEGTDPNENFSIKGVYQIGKPCGINCFMKTGGDVAVMTDSGLVAMSQVVSLDAAALENSSVSKNIRSLWVDAASRTDLNKWRITRNDKDGYAIVSVPAGTGISATQFIANLQTGAWSVWKGWNAETFAVVGNEIIFSDPDGVIYTGETGGSDNGQPYTATYIGPFRMNGMNRIHAKAMRAVIRSIEAFKIKVTALFEYNTAKPANPGAVSALFGPLWDSAKWDVSKWGGGKNPYLHWQAVSGEGTAIAPCVQITFNQRQEPDIDLIRTDIIVETGSVM